MIFFGSYFLRNEDNCFNITKKNEAETISYDRFFQGEYDSFNVRKAAYGLTRDSILNMFRSTKTTPIKGEDIVKIYKKKKKP